MAALDASVLSLQPRHLAMVRQILHAHLPEAEVWAYGSRVNGDSYTASDLDLVVRHPGDLSLTTPEMFEASEAFVDSNLPIQVQIVDWARIPAAFHDEIETAYVVLQRPLEAGKARLLKPDSNGMRT